MMANTFPVVYEILLEGTRAYKYMHWVCEAVGTKSPVPGPGNRGLRREGGVVSQGSEYGRSRNPLTCPALPCPALPSLALGWQTTDAAVPLTPLIPLLSR